MHRIRTDFKYDPKATVISTPLAEVFEKRHGVCQDFAHVMIAGLRGLGLPAAYVSGYLRTIPPAGQPRLQGADATHAWVSVCGADSTLLRNRDMGQGVKDKTAHASWSKAYGQATSLRRFSLQDESCQAAEIERFPS